MSWASHRPPRHSRSPKKPEPGQQPHLAFSLSRLLEQPWHLLPTAPLTWLTSPLRRVHLAASPLRGAHLAAHLGEGASAGRRKQPRGRPCSSRSPPSFAGGHHVGLGSLHTGRQGQGEAEGEGSRSAGPGEPGPGRRTRSWDPPSPASAWARGFSSLGVIFRLCK